MLGANPATRALLMPTQVSSPEMQAVQRRLGWRPATLNVSAVQTSSVAPLFRDDLPAFVREFQPLVSALDRLPIAQRVAGRDHLNQVLYVNAKTVLPNFILNYLADRMEMAHSIEGRVPFLDHHVAEVAARVPVNMKIKGIREKHVLREATKDVLIPEVYDRQKHPFTTPPTRNKNDPMLAFYRDTFASQAAKDQPIYDMKKVSATLDGLLDYPDDERVGVEGGLQRVASVVVMHEKFSMA
jgi:asparagine synthase (glutamine-hydrolysing)